MRAPLVIAVVSRAGPHVKIPEWEQVLSAGAAAMSLVLAAHALGYGANWITEWYAYDRGVLDALGLAPHEPGVASCRYSCGDQAIRIAVWTRRPPSELLRSGRGEADPVARAAPAPPQRSLPSITSKRNRPAPRSKARAGSGPPLGAASRARNREKNG